MNEEKFVPHYQQIANRLDESIPVEWEEIVMYGEVFDRVSYIVFHYRELNSSKWIHYMRVAKLYNIDDEIQDSIYSDLRCDVENLQNEFILQGLEPWKAMIFYINKDFNFKTDYHYELLAYDNFLDTTRADYWLNKKFDVPVNGDFDIFQLKKFMEEIGDNETFD